jgi:undecaprenyl-diphosphatase
MAEFFTNDFIVNIDAAIYTWIDGIMNPTLNAIMTFITHLGDTPGIIWFVLGICLLIPRRTRKLGVLVFAGLALSSVINNLILKELIGRPRPYVLWDERPEVWLRAGYEYHWPDLIKKSSSPSFPSGHTSTSIGAAFAMFLACFKKSDRKYLSVGIPALIISFLIGFSRIYVHVHYPTDVIVGAVVGLIGGLIAYLLIEKLFMKKAVPALEKKFDKKIF